MTTKPLALNDLPAWSAWTRRIMGAEPVTARERTVEDTEREYDREKYAECLAYHEADPSRTVEDVRAYETRSANDLICVSRGSALFLEPPAETRRRFMEILTEEVGKVAGGIDTVVELGSGYGYNLWWLAQRFPQVRYIGGDLSRNAAYLADRLYGNARVTIVPFNFFDERYALLEGLGRTLLLTVYAVAMMPSARHFVDRVLAAGATIVDVLQFEPLYELENASSMLGILRRRYVELNDYNRDLLSQLEARKEVSIVDLRHDVHGVNPLYPASFLRWQPRSPDRTA